MQCCHILVISFRGFICHWHLTGQKVKKLLYVLKCKTRFFSLNLVLKYGRLSKFVYEVPNHIALNQTMQSCTKACITKSCLTFKRPMSDICDGTPTLSPPNDRNMRRAATGTSSGADRFMMSNKTIQPDLDPCQ